MFEASLGREGGSTINFKCRAKKITKFEEKKKILMSGQSLRDPWDTIKQRYTHMNACTHTHTHISTTCACTYIYTIRFRMKEAKETVRMFEDGRVH